MSDYEQDIKSIHDRLFTQAFHQNSEPQKQYVIHVGEATMPRTIQLWWQSKDGEDNEMISLELEQFQDDHATFLNIEFAENEYMESGEGGDTDE